MRKVLTQDFFNRDTKKVAKELLGKFLVRKVGQRELALMITETEAYDGFEDRASHAFRGLTPRTKVMFGDPGHFYVYLCYGMYYLMNISTREAGHPAAVLIRGVEGINGPGKLTQHFKIDKTFSGRRVAKSSGAWVEDRGIVIPDKKILRTPRVGIHYAGEDWINKKWRYVWKQ